MPAERKERKTRESIFGDTDKNNLHASLHNMLNTREIQQSRNILGELGSREWVSETPSYYEGNREEFQSFYIGE